MVSFYVVQQRVHTFMFQGGSEKALRDLIGMLDDLRSVPYDFLCRSGCPSFSNLTCA